MTQIIFHDSLLSSAAWRVRAVLHFKSIAHQVRMHDIMGHTHRTPAYMRLNPQGTVPVLEVDGVVIPQSLAIIEYLEETRPSSRLLPSDPAARARVRLLSHIIAMETHAVTNRDVASDASDWGDMTDWMQRYIARGFDAFEGHLDHPATGTFCHGDTLTMADCCLIPQARNAEKAGVDLGRWRRIAAIYSRALEHPAFAEKHPDTLATATAQKG
ncbi:MAG: maleylacetoacetate isomerase [Gammaproteobacteria bacterium]